MAVVLLVRPVLLPWVEALSLVQDILRPGPLGRVQREPWSPGQGRAAIRGDLYRDPAILAPAALVLVPGATPAGKDDAGIVALSGALARAGFEVLAIDGGAGAFAPGQADIEAVAAGRAFFARAGRPAGIVAISYGVGPAIVAAIADGGPPPSFLLGVGGYLEIGAVIAHILAPVDKAEPDGALARMRAYGRWAFARANAGRLSDSGDRALIGILAERRRADPAAPVADLIVRMTPGARSIAELLIAEDAERVPSLLAALPPDLAADIRALDLSRRDLSALSGRLILVHGSNDPLVPLEQGRKLAAAVPGSRLFVLDGLGHVGFSGPDAASILAAAGAGRALIAARDAVASGGL